MKPFLFSLLLGIFLFFAGLKLMRAGLENFFFQQLQALVAKGTATPFRGFLSGVLATLLVQSSSAVTVLTIGLVNSGLLPFTQTIGIILGTNIGTCFTSQMIAFDFQKVTLPLLLAGALCLLGKKKRAQALGLACTGCGLLFAGLAVIGRGTLYLQTSPTLLGLLTAAGSHPFSSLLAGILITALLQSSSVVTGITVFLVSEGTIDLTAATAVILGSNLGTCLTGILASLGGNKASRKVAWTHVLLNAGGILIFFPLLEPFTSLLKYTASQPARQAANAHLIFNLVSSLAVLPFSRPFARLIDSLF